jgi:hypothetical protein
LYLLASPWRTGFLMLYSVATEVQPLGRTAVRTVHLGHTFMVMVAMVDLDGLIAGVAFGISVLLLLVGVEFFLTGRHGRRSGWIDLGFSIRFTGPPSSQMVDFAATY